MEQRKRTAMTDSAAPPAKSGVGRRDFIKLGAGAAVLAALTGPKAPAQQDFVPGWELRPRGASRPVSIDIHTHWTPGGYVQALIGLGRNMYGNPVPLRADLDKRRKWMDERGVQMFVLTLSGGMPWQWVSPAEAARLAQIVNDAAVEAHTLFPDRFIAAVEISILDPSLSVKELNRVAGKPGIRGVHLPPTVEGREYLFEPAYAPLLARCEELGYPLVLHPLDGEINYFGGPQTRLGGSLADSVRYWNTLGFPFETATFAAKLIVNGTLDKYPKLDVILPHSGGTFPFVAGRIEHGLGKRKFQLQHPFRDYIRRFHYDTMTYDLETLRFLVELVGSDRVMVGTDNSFGPGVNFEWPNAIVEHLNLPAADEDRILRGNAARLFRI